MLLIECILLGLALAMDAFAVALVARSSGRSRGKRAAFRLSFHFGLFQAIMPVLGWFGGSLIADALARWDHWLAFGLLAFIGGRMLFAGDELEDRKPSDPSRGLMLIGLSVAVSIDALAVGFSLAMLRVRILLPAIVIGLVTAAVSLLAVFLGRFCGRLFGKWMEKAGGLLLILLGLKILVSHLIAG